MDGTISVASEVGKGSTFTVSLPAYAAAADARQTAITAAAAVADESARQQATGLTPLLLYSSSSSNRRDAIMSPVQMEPKTPSAVSGGRSGTAAAAAAMADNQTARHPLRSGSSGSSSFNASAFANHPDAFAGIEVKAFRSADPAAAAAAAGSSHTRQQQQQAHTESSADLSDSDDWPTAKAPGSGSDFDKTAAAAAAAADAGSSSGGGGDQQAAYGDAITAECFYSEVNEGRIQLLVVDDDQANHEVMSLLLESAGYTLVHTYSGQETLKYLTKCQVLPDVVLLDAAMPGFDGREVCWRIRSMMAKSPLYLPIVMVTAQVSAYAVDASVAAGADDHLGKPFGRNDLLKCVRDNYKKQKRSI